VISGIQRKDAKLTPGSVRKRGIALPAPENLPEAGAMILALMLLSRTSLEKLLEAHHGHAGSWLDELERSITLNIKGTDVVGLPIEQEAKALNLCLDATKAIFDRVRQNGTFEDGSGL
jgi:hypothetical protein